MANLATDRGDDVVSTLPEDTAVAIGFGLPEGWLTKALDQAAAMSGGEMTADDLAAELEASTGLTVADLETLTGESAALALGSDVDLETVFSSSDGSDLPVGAKVKGDAAKIQDVVARLDRVARRSAGGVRHRRRRRPGGDRPQRRLPRRAPRGRRAR